MMARRATPLLIWVACVVFAAYVVARARYITDLSAFLPANPTAEQQLLVDQLRDGPASRLILIALEGGDAASRARASVAAAAKLRHDPEFTVVNNGDLAAAPRDREFLFQHRYLLSDSVNVERFSGQGLRAAISDTVDNLASPAGLLFKSLLPRDPTGELLNIIEQLDNARAPRDRDGVWVSPDGARALAVAQTSANGSDSDAQARAIDAIRTAFAALAIETERPGSICRCCSRQDRAGGDTPVHSQQYSRDYAAVARLSVAAGAGVGSLAGVERRSDRSGGGGAGLRGRSWHHLGLWRHLDRRIGGLFHLFFHPVAPGRGISSRRT
jgi:hypothetical protein